MPSGEERSQLCYSAPYHGQTTYPSLLSTIIDLNPASLPTSQRPIGITSNLYQKEMPIKTYCDYLRGNCFYPVPQKYSCLILPPIVFFHSHRRYFILSQDQFCAIYYSYYSLQQNKPSTPLMPPAVSDL